MPFEILQHPGIEQIDEVHDSKGLVFSTIYRLRGQYTISTLRDLLTDVIPLVHNDMAQGHYRVAGFNPDEVNVLEACQEKAWTLAMLRQFAGVGRAFYLDRRNSPDYGPSLPHTHPEALSTSIVPIEEGTKPTIFISDEAELLTCMRNSASGELKDAINQWIDSVGGVTPEQTARNVANTLSCYTSEIDPKVREALKSKMPDIKRSITKTERIPRAGNMTVFRNDVIHASGNGDSDPLVPGELLTQHWVK